MAAIAQMKIYDAVVVGSGITGGYAAMELTKKGLETLVLEAGRPISPERDYVEHVPPWQMRFRGLGDRGALARDQPIQRTCYACDEWSSKFFVNDRENPYTFDRDKPFAWIRGRHNVPLERSRIRGQSEGRPGRRLASARRRRGPLVRLRRGLRRHQRTGRGLAAASRREVPPADGVQLRRANQAHDVPNLFVTDGSVMTSSSCVNPSITYMMLTARACDYAVKEMALGPI